MHYTASPEKLIIGKFCAIATGAEYRRRTYCQGTCDASYGRIAYLRALAAVLLVINLPRLPWAQYHRARSCCWQVGTS